MSTNNSTPATTAATIAKPSPVRNASGRFLPGHTAPGPGRKRFAEDAKEKFALACRLEIRKRKLAPEKMADMAEGKGQYSKLSPMHRHQILMDMLSYAYGRPAIVQITDNSQNNTLIMKRIIGVPDDLI
jgi:hypothetical protein